MGDLERRLGKAGGGREERRAPTMRGCEIIADFTAPPHARPIRTRFVLIGTSHAGNVGAAARAMKVMGFADLVLVAPRFADVLHARRGARDGQRRDRRAGARARRRHAGRGAGRRHLRLRHRDDAARLRPADPRAARAVRRRSPPARTASRFVFGSERYGLRNEDVYRCHACLSIPTDPGYGSLNLAQAVQLLAYDWRQALGGFAVQPRTADAALRRRGRGAAACSSTGSRRWSTSASSTPRRRRS